MGNRGVAVAIFLLGLWAFAWMTPQDPGNAQVVTRLGLALSIVEDGRLDIDKFAHRTIDKAEIGGHYFADKTPGHSLLALPSLILARQAFILAGQPADSADPDVFARYAYIATLVTNGVLSALAAALLFLTAIRLGANRDGAIFASFALTLATPFYGWSTAFFAHSVSASLLLASMALIARFGAPASAAKPAAWQFGLLGLVLSYTAVVDLTTVPSLILLGLLTLYLLWRRTGRLPVPAVLALAAGGIVGALPLAVYNQLAFGSPLKLGYSSVVGFEGMQQGFFGITWPSALVLFELLFGLYRGLLPLAPVLILVPFGLLVMARDKDLRPFALVIALVIVAHLAINASYHYWNGGWSTGPRHLVPMLPLAALALAFALPNRRPARLGAALLLGVSLVLSLICAAGGMFAPERYPNPFLDYLLPNFLVPLNLLRSVPVLVSWLGFALLLKGARRRGTVPGRGPA